MYIPFLAVTIAAGTPRFLAALSLAAFSSLSASLTHYGTTPAPIYFGSGGGISMVEAARAVVTLTW
jgi:DASS family divalent anion:Na+ symporter